MLLKLIFKTSLYIFLFWENFRALRLATGLIPKMAPSMSLTDIHYSSFNAVEVKIRNKFSKEIPADGLITQMIEDRDMNREDTYPATFSVVVPVTTLTTSSQSQLLSPDPKKATPRQSLTEVPKQSSGLFNMVYNYFTPVPTEAEEEAKKRDYIMSG